MAVTAKAIWGNTLLAESHQTVEVHSTRYSPPEANGKRNANAAWHDPERKQ